MRNKKLKDGKTGFFSKEILLVVSAVYIAMSIGGFVIYELGLKEALLQIPPEARPYAGDTVQFLATSWFGMIVGVGGLLGVFWIFFLKRRVAFSDCGTDYDNPNNDRCLKVQQEWSCEMVA